MGPTKKSKLLAAIVASAGTCSSSGITAPHNVG